MPTPRLTLDQKMQNDMQRTARETSQMGQEGATINDVNASQRKTPVLATAAGATMAPPQRTRKQAIGRRPVFRSQTLAASASPREQQQASGRAFDYQGQDGQALAGYLMDTAAQGAPRQTMQATTPAPLMQQQATGDRVSTSIFDDVMNTGDRFQTSPNVGDVTDYYGNSGADRTPGDFSGYGSGSGSAVDAILGGETWGMPGREQNNPAGNLPSEGNADGPTYMDALGQWLMEQVYADSEAEKAAARERSGAASSQLLADAQSQMGTAGFFGSTLMPELSGDIQRQQQRALSEELLGIDNATRQAQLQAGGLLIDREGQLIQSEAFKQAMELAQQVLGGGDGTTDTTTDGGQTPDSGILDQAGIGDFVEQMFNPTDVGSASEIPGYDAGDAWAVPGTSGLYRGTDGNFYRVGGAGAQAPSGGNAEPSDNSVTGDSPGEAAQGTASAFGPGGWYWDLIAGRN